MKASLAHISRIAGIVVTLGVCSLGTTYAATSNVSVSVSAGSVSIAAPSSVAFPSATVSNTGQTLNVSAGQFTVEDLKGAAAGYYVTMSMSDLTDGSGNTITKSNVTGTIASGTVTTVAGNTNAAVTVPTSGGTIGAGYVAVGTATTIIQRSSAGGIQGKYGVSPDLRINVPAYTPAGSYAGTLTFTLIEN